MYAGLTKSRPLPENSDQGKHFSGPNGYVYWYTKRWYDPEKKRTVDDRVLIGKLDPNNKGQFFPNKRFDAIFAPVDPVLAELQQFYTSEARKKAGKFDFYMSFGPYAALQGVGKRVGCLDALQRAFPTLWKKIFAISLHSIISEESTAQSFPGWAFDNYVGLKHIISDSEISRVYSEIDKSKGSINIFFELFRANYTHNFPCSSEFIIAFDSTNQVSESKNQPQAKFGKAKSGEKLPVINTAMFVDEKTGINLWYEHFDGNVLDKSQSPYTLEKTKELGFRNIFLIMDRGYYDIAFISKIYDLQMSFAIILPDSVNLNNELIEKHKNDIAFKEQYYINSEDIYGIQTVVKLYYGKKEIIVFAYIFYDDNTANNIRNSIHSKINFYINEANKKIRYTNKLKEYCSKRFLKITKTNRNNDDNKNFKVEIDCNKVDEQCKNAGYFVVLSNKLISPTEIIECVRGRDKVEKNFLRLKNHFNLTRTYTHSEKTYNGKMFVAFFSLILLNAFEFYERDILRYQSSFSISTIISELHKYKIQSKKDGSWMPVYCLNALQKEILSKVDCNEDELLNSVKYIDISRQ